jgi:heterodisulfide reductase subunit B
MAKYALFLGCNIPARVKEYETSARAVLERLGVGLEDSRWFTCCGYPLRNLDRSAFLLSAARNLALAHSMGLDMLVLCKCCFGTLKAAQDILETDEEARHGVERGLRAQGLEYAEGVAVKHILSVLRHEVGIEAIKERVTNPLSGLRIAAHYGCHALRPARVTGFDDPVAPSIMEELVEAAGASSLEWDPKLDCCGAPLLGVNDELSMDLARSKLGKAQRAGADYLCTACPYCQLQFSTARERAVQGGSDAVPVVLYTSLLAQSMGILDLGLERDAEEEASGVEPAS